MIPRARSLPPPLVFVLGFGGLIALGSVLLWLPVSSASGAWTSPLDAAFTATSAVCVTGLIVVDTGSYWSPFGQLVVLGLIQLGGFGFMTSATLLLFAVLRRQTSLRDRVLLQASTGEIDLGRVPGFVRRVAVFTLVAEGAGAALLAAAFLADGADPGRAVWWGLFHAISAFNNAGFDVMGEFASLTRVADQPLILGVIGALIVLGGLGFAILGDVMAKRSWVRLALETKVVLLLTTVLLFGGAVAVALLEWNNPATLGQFGPLDRITNAAFASISARTAGFNAIAIGHLAVPTLLVMILLMFIGGGSGSTAGGVKVNTLGVLLMTVVSVVRGRPFVGAFGRRIPDAVVYRAIAVALYSIALLVVITVGLLAATGLSALPVLFEAASGMATVGLTTGITPQLPEAARVILVAAMFAGRVGPLTVVLALAGPTKPLRQRFAVEEVRLG